MRLTASPDTEFPLELPIFIHYRPSSRVGIFNTLVHAGAIFCLFLADIPGGIAVFIGTGVILHFCVYLRRYFSPSDLHFKLDQHNHWQLLKLNHEAIDLDLRPAPFVHPLIVALRFKDATGQTYSCVLTHDNLDRQTLRRLRVRLRWHLQAGRSSI